MTTNVAHNTPLRLHWWKAEPNFGDALSPLILLHMAGREVKHASPKAAEVFAIGSLMQVVKRNYDEANPALRPVIWGTGLLHTIQAIGFIQHIDVALLRGPVTAAILGVDHNRFGDPGLLVHEALPFKGTRTDRIGIVPHHTLLAEPELLALVASDPKYMLIDPRKDPTTVCHEIASCAHVYASSLHALIVADAYGVSNTWLAPKGQSRLKYLDYAASVGRTDMKAPTTFADVTIRGADHITYQGGIDVCRAALYATFPSHLKAKA